MRIAYLTNQYPKVSHTFIRREIRALEELGDRVFRYSIRPSPDQLVDTADIEENAQTRVLLADGAARRRAENLNDFVVGVLRQLGMEYLCCLAASADEVFPVGMIESFAGEFRDHRLTVIEGETHLLVHRQLPRIPPAFRDHA